MASIRQRPTGSGQRRYYAEVRIKVAAMILGVAFLVLAFAALRRPFPALLVGLGLFLAVCVTAAVGGSSPLSEGWPVKLLFLATLGGAVLVLRAMDGPAAEVQEPSSAGMSNARSGTPGQGRPVRDAGREACRPPG